ncbi:MAG: M20/M25/M40 family metallo-hydrolase, partial [Acidobacteriota bacterium]|nr:M20/M25/M40 family metallo-hydrolase [Acidobacteriota bacterium]
MSSVAKHVKSLRTRHLAELEELLSIPSVSTDPERRGDVRRAASWLKKRLRTAGCKTVEVHDTPGHPIVYGEWTGAGNAPTILVYGHYDVQPVDPIELWDTPPFEPTIRSGKIFARGSSDDKGQVITHVNALEAHLANGGCPVNI